MKKLCTFILVFFFYQITFSQVQFNISETSANQSSSTTIDVRVSDFIDISSMQFSINWDENVLNYSDITNISTTLPQFNSNLFGSPEQPGIDEGELTVLWSQTSTEGFTINEQNHLLFSIVFDVVGNPCDVSVVELSGTPRPIEFADSNQELVDVISNDGSVMINGSGCGTGDIVFNIPEETSMSGGSVCFEVLVDNFSDISAVQLPFQWEPDELSNLSVENINSAFVPSPVSIIDESTGTLKFFWQDDTAENPISLGQGAKLFDLCFAVDAASGTNACVVIEDISTPPPSFVTEILDSDDNVVNFIDDDGCALIQGGSTDITFYYEDIELVLGSNVCIPIKTRNFDDLQTFQYAIDFDSNVLTYTGVDDLNSDLPISAGAFGLIGDDNLRVSWSDLSGFGIDIDDEVTLFSVCFDVMGDCDQTTDVVFSGNIPGGVEITDIDNNTLPFVFETGVVTIVCPCNVVSVMDQTNNVSCFGDSDGKITVEANGGNGNYTYMWSNEQTGPMISGLPAGFYTVTVSDGENCNTSETFQITQPSEIVIMGDVTDETVDCDGEIDLTVSGGNGGFSYEWSDGPETTQDRTGLCKGDYTVTVTDSNDCTGTASFTIEPKPLQVDDADIINVSCNGGNDGSINLAVSGGCEPYSFNWSPNGPTGLSAGTYSVTITDSSTPPMMITQMYPVTEPDPIIITNVVIVPATGSMNNGSINLMVDGGTPNYTFLWTPGNFDTEDINNIASGKYTLLVTDDNGCTYSEEFNVGTDQVLVDLVTDPDNQYNGFDVACQGDCNGIIGGTIIAANGEVSFTIDGENTSLPITDLCPGTYTIAYSDENGLTGSQMITINDAEPITTSFIDVSECSNGNDGEATVIVTGGTENFTYEWSGSTMTTSTVNDLDVGDITVLITDENDCQVMAVTSIDACETPNSCYEASPILSPNQDGSNEQFIISCINDSNNTLFIYDRYGKTVFEQANYDNSWTGLSISGAELPENGYMWVLEVITNDGSREIYKGTVTILRSTY